MQHNKKFNTARHIAFIVATVLLCGVIAFAVPTTVSAAESGTCGPELTWTYNAGTLTISGKGNMTNFTERNMPPWYHLRDSILRIVLPADLSSIGDFAFYECNNLVTVNIPDYVLSIGRYSFAKCENLQSLRFGDRVSKIGASAFYCCLKLDAFRLPPGLMQIDNQAFYRCESLTTLSIPINVSKMGTSAFAYCKNLIKVEIAARLVSVPEWTFYGCDNLSLVILSPTVSSVESYAFKRCDQLSTVYFNGDADKKANIESGIVEDVPVFESTGYISDSTPPDLIIGANAKENGDGTITQTNTTVKEQENVTVVSKVSHTRPENTTKGGSYVADVKVTVEGKDGWQEATNSIKDTLSEINSSYTQSNAKKEKVDVTVYLKDETPVDSSFVEEMAGRDVEMTVVTQNGSTYRVECADVKKEELSGSYNYSYNVSESTADINTKLGTDNCYQVSFSESAQINAEVLVKLPKDSTNSNAFLYQVEDNGDYTRLQAVAIDNNNNAHFYLASVDKDTQYVIGVNVPGERTDDVIIPDELLPQYGNAVERLQKIDYVITGRQSSWGLSAMQVTMILLGVLAGCIIIVGIIMTVLHKQRLKNGYYERKMLLYAEGEDFDDDDDTESDEDE